MLKKKFNTGEGGISVYDIRNPKKIKYLYDFSSSELSLLIMPQWTGISFY